MKIRYLLCAFLGHRSVVVCCYDTFDKEGGKRVKRAFAHTFCERCGSIAKRECVYK